MKRRVWQVSWLKGIFFLQFCSINGWSACKSGKYARWRNRLSNETFAFLILTIDKRDREKKIPSNLTFKTEK